MRREVFGTFPRQIRGRLDRSNAFYCSFLIASLYMPPFLIASIVSRVIARRVSSEIPLIVGLRGFKQKTVEVDMSNGIYRQLSLRGRIITLFDRKRIAEARGGRFLEAGLSEPTPRAILNYGSATLIAYLALSGSYYLDLGFPYSMFRYQFWFDLIALGFLSYWMLKLEAENIGSAVLPLVAGFAGFYALIEEHPFWAIVVSLITIAIAHNVWNRLYENSAGVIESEKDLRSLSRELTGTPPLRGGTFFPIGFGVRANLYVEEAFWQPTVLELIRNASLAVIDISAPSESLRWEISKVRAAGLREYIVCKKAARDAALSELATIISKIDKEYD